MQADHYSLKWSELPGEAFSSFRQLRERGLFVDVACSVSGEVFRAHQIVLVACSPYFERILVPLEDGEGAFDLTNRYPVLVMNEEDPSIFRLILDFMYRGETEVPSVKLAEFLRLAETLEVKGLKYPQGSTMNVAANVNLGMVDNHGSKLAHLSPRGAQSSPLKADWGDARVAGNSSVSIYGIFIVMK